MNHDIELSSMNLCLTDGSNGMFVIYSSSGSNYEQYLLNLYNTSYYSKYYDFETEYVSLGNDGSLTFLFYNETDYAYQQNYRPLG